MKVNTKTMTPISKVAPDTMKSAPNSCYFNPNKHIDDGASALKKISTNEDDDDDDSTFGFVTRYLPTVFYTPVKSSSRFESEGTVDADGVDALNKAFGKLLLKTKEEEKSESADEKEKSAEATETSVDDNDDSNDGKNLGRFNTRDTTHKSAPKKVNVTRSYRLVVDKE